MGKSIRSKVKKRARSLKRRRMWELKYKAEYEEIARRIADP
jgi:hypothetical protein